MTVAAAVEAYIAAKSAEGRADGTLEQYAISLKAIRESGLGALAAARATPDAVRAFLSWRRCHVWRTRAGTDGKAKAELVEGGRASNSVLYRDRGLLAAVFNWLVEEGRATTNPVLRVKPPKKRQTIRRPFELEEIHRFLAACDPDHLRPIVLAGLFVGQGREELIHMRWRDVSFARATVAVVRKKSGKTIDIPLNPILGSELKALRERRAKAGRIPGADEAVFLSRYGRGYAEFPRGAWTTAIRSTGLDGRGLTPHSLRRSFATYYEGQDVDLQQLLGHADIRTTLIYRRSRDDRKRASVVALNFGLAAGPDGVRAVPAVPAVQKEDAWGSKSAPEGARTSGVPEEGEDGPEVATGN
jgi:integrase